MWDPARASSVPRHADIPPIQRPKDDALIDVYFHILSSLPCHDSKPTIVRREWETSQHRAHI